MPFWKKKERLPRSPEESETGYYDWYCHYKHRLGWNLDPIDSDEWERKLQPLAWQVAGGKALPKELWAKIEKLRNQHAVKEATDRARREDFKRWEESSVPEQWVDQHRGVWTQDDYQEFLASLKASSYWPLDESRVKVHLSALAPKRWNLISCVEHGDAEALSSLLAKSKMGVDRNKVSSGQAVTDASLGALGELNKGLPIAAAHGQVDCLRVLLDYGGDPNTSSMALSHRQSASSGCRFEWPSRSGAPAASARGEPEWQSCKV
jgi:hypothetical protein